MCLRNFIKGNQINKRNSQKSDRKLSETRDTFDNTGLDESGYQALEIPQDDFLKKVNIIREQLQRNSHPVTQFLACFDEEF